eukprot:TRINITY_DN38154_c0_g1_i1.p1 TRINITY_DN38154_c0_g1~~TRINITY_DN38154_c0_g1_i1.p1  ORF type:complete len:575 (-),score=71.96 TRINITY_DN38154_c0_g1_i1:54-1778(-)
MKKEPSLVFAQRQKHRILVGGWFVPLISARPEGQVELLFIVCSYSESEFLDPIINVMLAARPGSLAVFAACDQAQQWFGVKTYPVYLGSQGRPFARRLSAQPERRRLMGIEDIPEPRVIVTGMTDSASASALLTLKSNPESQAAVCFASDFVLWDPTSTMALRFAFNTDAQSKTLCDLILVPTARQQLDMEYGGVQGKIVTIGNPAFQTWSRKSSNVYEIGMVRKRLFGDQFGIILVGSGEVDVFGIEVALSLFCEASKQLASKGDIAFRYIPYPFREAQQKYAEDEFLFARCPHVQEVWEVCFEANGNRVVRDVTEDEVAVWNKRPLADRDFSRYLFCVSHVTATLAADAVCGYLTSDIPKAVFNGIHATYAAPQSLATGAESGSGRGIGFAETFKLKNIFANAGLIAVKDTPWDLRDWMIEVKQNSTQAPGGLERNEHFLEKWHQLFSRFPADPTSTLCKLLIRKLEEAEKNAADNDKADLLKDIGVDVPPPGDCESPAREFILQILGMIISSFGTQIVVFLYVWWQYPWIINMICGNPVDCCCPCLPEKVRSRCGGGSGGILEQPGSIEMT